MTPQVSVVIPTYKHSQYVLATLDSVFAQTHQNYEVIVINDGSPDDTAQVLKPLIEQNCIQYIEQANQGQAATRNRGLALARGEFIAFLDDDDLWPPDKLEWQVAFLNDHAEVSVVGGSVRIIDEAGEETGEERFPKKPVTFESLFSGCPFLSPGQTLIRASQLRQVGSLREDLWGVDDFDLWFRLLQNHSITVLPRLSLLYRFHASNASNDTSKMFYNILKVIKTHLPNAPVRKRAKLSRDAYRWLYKGIGKEIVGHLRVHKLTPFSQAIKNLNQLSHFFWPALRDRRLLRQILQDVIPDIFNLKQLSR